MLVLRNMITVYIEGNYILGRCNIRVGPSSELKQLTSCWKPNEGVENPSTLADYYYDGPITPQNPQGNPDCYLDRANGIWFGPGKEVTAQASDGYVGYGYVTTTNFPGVPMGLVGDDYGYICGI